MIRDIYYSRSNIVACNMRCTASLDFIQYPDNFIFQQLFHVYKVLNSVYISVIGSDMERVSIIGLSFRVFNGSATPSNML